MESRLTPPSFTVCQFEHVTDSFVWLNKRVKAKGTSRTPSELCTSSLAISYNAGINSFVTADSNLFLTSLFSLDNPVKIALPSGSSVYGSRGFLLRLKLNAFLT